MKGFLPDSEGEPGSHPDLCKGHPYQKKRHVDTIRKLKPVAVIFIVGTILTFWTLKTSWPWSSQQFNVMMSGRFGKPVPEIPLEIKALIQKLKDARLRAEAHSSKSPSEFTERDRQAWHNANPCISRHELRPLYNERHHREILEEHPYLAAVLREYSYLHRACMQNVGRDIVKFFVRKDASSGCKFILGDNEVGTGIGNKILSAAAQVVYAILTQRVLLVPVSTSVPDVLCEPFEGSSWRVVTDGILTPGKLHPEMWRSVADVNREVDNFQYHGRSNGSAIYAARVNENWDCQPQKRFFCDAEQAFYDEHVTWMYFSECLYYLPKLFAVPRFRATLEALFPDRMVLTHVLRTALLPADPIWLRVQQLNHVHLRHVDRRVGIQARYFHGKSDFKLLHKATEAAVAKCLQETHLLPNSSTDNALFSGTPTKYLVFITSLYDGIKDHLTKIYVRRPSRAAVVGIVQLTHEDRQQFGVEVDRQALTEVLGLSLCDEIIVTPQSTFGAIAAAYGGMVPYFVDIRINTSSPGCVRGHSVDACYQLPSSKHYTCPHNKDVDQKLIADVVPYIRDCHPIETPFLKVHGAGLGFQIMSGYNQSLRTST